MKVKPFLKFAELTAHRAIPAGDLQMVWTISDFLKKCEDKDMLEKEGLRFDFYFDDPTNRIPLMKWLVHCWKDFDVDVNTPDIFTCYIGLRLTNHKEVTNYTNGGRIYANLRVETLHNKDDSRAANDYQKGDDGAYDMISPISWAIHSFTLNQSFKDNILSDGKLVLRLTMKIFFFDGPKPDPSLAFQTFARSAFKALFWNQHAEHDSKIFSIEGDEFWVHEAVLGYYSPVLRQRFRSQIGTKDAGIIRFDDLSTDVLYFILNYMYHGAVVPFLTHCPGQCACNECASAYSQLKDCKPVFVTDLLRAVVFYELKELVKYFDYKLPKICDTKNAHILHELAKTYHLEDAKARIEDYVRHHPDVPTPGPSSYPNIMQCSSSSSSSSSSGDEDWEMQEGGN